MSLHDRRRQSRVLEVATRPLAMSLHNRRRSPTSPAMPSPTDAPPDWFVESFLRELPPELAAALRLGDFGGATVFVRRAWLPGAVVDSLVVALRFPDGSSRELCRAPRDLRNGSLEVIGTTFPDPGAALRAIEWLRTSFGLELETVDEDATPLDARAVASFEVEDDG